MAVCDRSRAPAPSSATIHSAQVRPVLAAMTASLTGADAAGCVARFLVAIRHTPVPRNAVISLLPAGPFFVADAAFRYRCAPPQRRVPMPEYTGTPDFTHGMPPRLGLLLVNLGTPDAPTTRAVRRYLAEFLSDPRVVEAPRALWWLALHGVVLRIRPRRSAAAYARIWTPQGSPLLVHSEALTQALQRRLAVRFGDRVLVSLAMSYGLPSIDSALEHLRRQNVRRLLVLPLFPQYSGTTTASVFARVTAELARWRWIPELRFVNDYHDEEAYLAAVADSVAEHWRLHGRKHLLFSFHSIPQRYFAAGDPYHCQCQATARGVAARLDLAADDWSVAFQSRIGREPWLQPYTDVLLERYAQSGPRQVTVVCPGFAVDCLETLEEIDMRNRAAFFLRGGDELDYVPCLNSSERHIHLLEQLLIRHAHGWPEIEGRGK